jgi:uncharacterized protein DUF5681
MTTHFGDPPYESGYGKPPLHSRWPKGTSGNPRGRPKGSTNYLTILRRVLGQKVTLREGGKQRRITKIEAAMTQLLNKAAQGDSRAFQAILKVVVLLGVEPKQEKGGLTFIIEG